MLPRVTQTGPVIGVGCKGPILTVKAVAAPLQSCPTAEIVPDTAAGPAVIVTIGEFRLFVSTVQPAGTVHITADEGDGLI